MVEHKVSRCELIVGGQKSGKSVRAEQLALTWLQTHASHRAVLLATAQAWDDEMQARIARHQQSRAQRVPGMQTVEEPLHVAAALQRLSTPETLIVVDCLTLWLTNWMMPADDAGTGAAVTAPVSELCDTLQHLPGPVVVVSNEIGLGVIPMGAQVRAFVDALGWLNQSVAQASTRVTLMAAGLPLTLKEAHT